MRSRGAIVLTPDMSKCLLVRGYKKDAGWGFPRGKLSKDESDAQCAVREVRVAGMRQLAVPRVCSAVHGMPSERQHAATPRDSPLPLLANPAHPAWGPCPQAGRPNLHSGLNPSPPAVSRHSLVPPPPSPAGAGGDWAGHCRAAG